MTGTLAVYNKGRRYSHAYPANNRFEKYYGTEPNLVRALDGVNFSAEEGEFVAVVGTSGSGKSTLLHIPSNRCLDLLNLARRKVYGVPN